MKTIKAGANDSNLEEALSVYQQASFKVALTGAGISVHSGISDFRSPKGLWSKFAPEEYATLDVFLSHPKKAWDLYRALGKELLGRKPNPAHHALADLEKAGFLQAVITQNVDRLHHAAGNEKVTEIHGDHSQLQCIECDLTFPVIAQHYQEPIPTCPHCISFLKPNVVLFGEPVRDLGQIEKLLTKCDLLLVIGTSASVYPAASLPLIVQKNRGKLFEFNLSQSLGSSNFSTDQPDFFFKGDLGKTLPHFAKSLLRSM